MGEHGPLPNVNSERARIAKSRGELQVVLAPSDPPAPPEDYAPTALGVWDDAWRCAWVCDSDRADVDALCRTEDDLARMCATVAAEGETSTRPLTSARGDVVGHVREIHPLVVEIRRGRVLANALRQQLGLTPVSRARLGVTVLLAEVQKDIVERLQEKREERRRTAECPSQ